MISAGRRAAWQGAPPRQALLGCARCSGGVVAMIVVDGIEFEALRYDGGNAQDICAWADALAAGASPLRSEENGALLVPTSSGVARLSARDWVLYEPESASFVHIRDGLVAWQRLERGTLAGHDQCAKSRGVIGDQARKTRPRILPTAKPGASRPAPHSGESHHPTRAG